MFFEANMVVASNLYIQEYRLFGELYVSIASIDAYTPRVNADFYV